MVFCLRFMMYGELSSCSKEGASELEQEKDARREPLWLQRGHRVSEHRG